MLRQITRRYRAALVANLGVLAALSIGSVGVLAWRLHAVGLDRPWVVGIPTALGVVAVAGLGWRLKRRWMAGMGTASHLDRALGLQERLITAAEFAHRTPPPALYPLLLDDAAQHFSREQVRLPRLVDRSGIVLAIILLLLFCWPGRGNVPMQLAQLPSTPPPIPPPQPQPPPEPKQQTPPQNMAGPPRLVAEAHTRHQRGLLAPMFRWESSLTRNFASQHFCGQTGGSPHRR